MVEGSFVVATQEVFYIEGLSLNFRGSLIFMPFCKVFTNLFRALELCMYLQQEKFVLSKNLFASFVIVYVCLNFEQFGNFVRG